MLCFVNLCDFYGLRGINWYRLIIVTKMKIGHIAIWARDIEKLKNFYTHYFHATSGEKYFNPKKNFHSYFLSFEDECRLELMQMPGIQENDNNQGGQYFGLT